MNHHHPRATPNPRATPIVPNTDNTVGFLMVSTTPYTVQQMSLTNQSSMVDSYYSRFGILYHTSFVGEAIHSLHGHSASKCLVSVFHNKENTQSKDKKKEYYSNDLLLNKQTIIAICNPTWRLHSNPWSFFFFFWSRSSTIPPPVSRRFWVRAFLLLLLLVLLLTTTSTVERRILLLLPRNYSLGRTTSISMPQTTSDSWWRRRPWPPSSNRRSCWT